METVDAGAVAFRREFRLRFEPVLHIVAGLGTLVFVGEVGPARDFIRRGRKVDFVLIQPGGAGLRIAGRPMGLVLGKIMALHTDRIVGIPNRPPWGVHPIEPAGEKFR